MSLSKFSGGNQKSITFLQFLKFLNILLSIFDSISDYIYYEYYHTLYQVIIFAGVLRAQHHTSSAK